MVAVETNHAHLNVPGNLPRPLNGLYAGESSMAFLWLSHLLRPAQLTGGARSLSGGLKLQLTAGVRCFSSSLKLYSDHAAGPNAPYTTDLAEATASLSSSALPIYRVMDNRGAILEHRQRPDVSVFT